jgi:HEAT repeat protein
MDIETSLLIEQLKDPHSEVRLSAAVALGEFERISPNSLTILAPHLKDADREVRLAVIASLMKIWRGLTGTMGDLLTPGDEIDQAFGPLNEALLGALRDEDKYVRMSAAEGLRDLFSTDNEVFDVFVAAASDPDESLRRRAALSLWLGASDRRATLFQVESEAGIAALQGLLNDESKDVRGYALRAIASVGREARTSVPILQDLLREEDEDIRFNGALAIARLETESEPALNILTEALLTGDRLKRKAAAFALRAMGPNAKPAIPALVKGLKDQEKRVRSRCAAALGKFGAAVNDDVIHALLETERDDEPDVRLAVERALAEIGKDRVSDAQKRAAHLAARNHFPLFGFKPEEIPGLIFMLKDPSADTRAMAATALGHLGAREAIPELLNLLNDEDEDVRHRAAHSLQTMGVSTASEDV